jgi:mRNA-degrading endonuclease RelE of RelBE toxin-antitoxin system
VPLALEFRRSAQGEHDAWRVRVGDYRVLYAIDTAGGRVIITAIRHRGDVYRTR